MFPACAPSIRKIHASTKLPIVGRRPARYNAEVKSRKPPTDLRRYQLITDRNLLIGFFVVLFVVGGALIYLFYGLGGLSTGLLCMLGGALLAGVVVLVVFGFEWLGRWLEERD